MLESTRDSPPANSGGWKNIEMVSCLQASDKGTRSMEGISQASGNGRITKLTIKVYSVLVN